MARDVIRTIHYRNANCIVPLETNLETVVRTSLNRSPLAIDRRRNLGHDVFQVLNTFANVNNTLCGSLHRWVHGQNQLIVEQDPNAATWQIREVAPPAQAGTQRDFLPFSLFFGLRGNHLVVLQSQGMMAPELGDYFSWLIVAKAPEMTAPNQKVSMFPASSAMLRQHGIENAKAIRVTKSMADLHARAPEGRRRKPWFEKVVPAERAAAFTNALNTLGVPTPQALLIQPESKDLEIYLEIRRPRGGEPHGNPVMNEIGKLVAQQESDEYAVELLDGSEIRGSKLKLSKDITLTIPDAYTHPSEMAIFQKIDEYLRHLIQANMV
jgi:hypothetical protein